MTKASMKQYLADVIEELSLMKEPEDFAEKAKELFATLRTIPQKERSEANAERCYASWEQTFSYVVNELSYHSQMRKKGSIDKRYYKPALTNSFKRAVIASLSFYITFSVLADYSIAPGKN